MGANMRVTGRVYGEPSTQSRMACLSCLFENVLMGSYLFVFHQNIWAQVGFLILLAVLFFSLPPTPICWFSVVASIFVFLSGFCVLDSFDFIHRTTQWSPPWLQRQLDYGAHAFGDSIHS